MRPIAYEAGADWPFLCGRWPHPNHTGAPLSATSEMVGVWTHGSDGRGAGSGQSPLYLSASGVGWSGISRRRHAFEPQLVWVLVCSCIEDEPA
jgi:hypothetical protein